MDENTYIFLYVEYLNSLEERQMAIILTCIKLDEKTLYLCYHFYHQGSLWFEEVCKDNCFG